MSTPLILTPSISFSNSSTALVAAPFAEIPEAGAAQHLSRARQVLERDLTPALRRVHNGALEHDVGMQEVPQHSTIVRLDEVAPAVEGSHLHISGVGRRYLMTHLYATSCYGQVCHLFKQKNVMRGVTDMQLPLATAGSQPRSAAVP